MTPHTQESIEVTPVLRLGLSVFFVITIGWPVLHGQGNWETTGALNLPRFNHTATLLEDGRVLVVGGRNADGQAVATAELYSSDTGIWTLTKSLKTDPRSNHTATLLPDGRVLVVGGGNRGISLYEKYGSAEIFDPVTEEWTVTGSLIQARDWHTSTLLPDGRVLVVGGLDDKHNPIASIEIYEPTTGKWSVGIPMKTRRAGHAAVLLQDGSVLIVGGASNPDDSRIVEVFDPETGQWATTGSLNEPAVDRWPATLLNDGRVVIVGGTGYSRYLSRAEVYDPVARSWSLTGSLRKARSNHTATLLPDGRILVAGGFDGCGGSCGNVDEAELYDPRRGTWQEVASIQHGRSNTAAVLLQDGGVLVTGGSGNEGTLSSCEIFTKAVADLAVEKSASNGLPRVGEEYRYTLTVLNQGPDPATNITVRDELPDEVELISKAGAMCSEIDHALDCQIESLSEDQSRSITLTVVANQTGVVENVATVYSYDDPELANNESSISVNVVLESDLKVTKLADRSSVRQGGTFRYLINIANSGPDRAGEVLLTDELPEGVSLLSIAPSQGECVSESDILTCELGEIEPDGSADVTVSVRALEVGSVLNVATADSAEEDPDRRNNSDSVVVEVLAEADLEITKSVSASLVNMGQQFEYEITVRNTGPNVAPAVIVDDPLPKAIEFLWADPSQGNCSAEVTCDLGLLGVDEAASIHIAARARNSGLIENVAEVGSNALDPNKQNDRSSVGLQVISLRSLAVPYDPGISGGFIGLAVVNLGADDSWLNIRGLTSGGGLKTEQDFEQPIPSFGQVAFLTYEIVPSDVDTVLLSGLQGPIQGFFMIGDSASDRLDGIGGVLEDSETLYLPRLVRLGDQKTTIFLFNLSLSKTAELTVEFFDTSGSSHGRVARRLSPLGSLRETVDDLRETEAAFTDGYVKIESTSPVRGFEVIQDEETFVTVPAMSPIRARELAAPHLFTAKSGGTTLRILNLNKESTSVTAKVTDDQSGSLDDATFEVPGLGLTVQNIGELLDGEDEVQGFLELGLEGGSIGGIPQEPTVVPIITYDGGSMNTMSSLPLLREGRAETVFLQVAQSADLGIFTGLAIANLGDSTVTVTVEAYAEDGTRSALKTFELDPNQRRVALLNDTLYFGSEFEQVKGHLRVTATGPVYSFALFGGPRFLSAIEGQAPLGPSPTTVP